MKRVLSFLLVLVMIFSMLVFAVSCGNGDDTDNDKENNPPIGNDEDNTWNEDGTAIGRPVPILPTN